MEFITLPKIETTAGYNEGQKREQVFRYALTGKIVRADNVPSDVSADVLDIQVKSFHSTVCKGHDIEAGIAKDSAKRFAYVTKDCTGAYIMDKAEWLEFVTQFHSFDRESRKNTPNAYGFEFGEPKTRLSRAENKMVEWCKARL